MLEKTGYAFEEYIGGADCFRSPFFMGPGFTDEASSAVFGYVDIENCQPKRESSEDIEVTLATINRLHRKRIPNFHHAK